MKDIWKLRRSAHPDDPALPKGLMEAESVRVRRQGRGVLIEPVEPDMSWIDRLEALDDDAAAAALERPGPDSYERPDLSLD